MSNAAETTSDIEYTPDSDDRTAQPSEIVHEDEDDVDVPEADSSPEAEFTRRFREALALLEDHQPFAKPLLPEGLGFLDQVDDATDSRLTHTRCLRFSSQQSRVCR